MDYLTNESKKNMRKKSSSRKEIETYSHLRRLIESFLPKVQWHDRENWERKIEFLQVWWLRRRRRRRSEEFVLIWFLPSFQTGALFCNEINWSVSRCFDRSNKPSDSFEKKRKIERWWWWWWSRRRNKVTRFDRTSIIWWSSVIPGTITFIFRGPRKPIIFVSYWTKTKNIEKIESIRFLRKQSTLILVVVVPKV